MQASLMVFAENLTAYCDTNENLQESSNQRRRIKNGE
jgi:hypothetical protein